MPKNKVSDLISDQEISFARLVLSGTMTDRRAAEVVGLNPDSAAYTKSKPRVRDYMREHRAAVQQQLVEQETEGLRQQNRWRQQVLDRLWEIAAFSPEVTRGSITGQVKALSMIVAIEGLIPDRRAVDRLGVSSKKNPVPASPEPQKEDEPGIPDRSPMADPPPHPGPSQPAFANRSTPSQTRAPYVPLFTSVPDLGVSFSRNINPFVHPR